MLPKVKQEHTRIKGKTEYKLLFLLTNVTGKFHLIQCTLYPDIPFKLK